MRGNRGCGPDAIPERVPNFRNAGPKAPPPVVTSLDEAVILRGSQIRSPFNAQTLLLMIILTEAIKYFQTVVPEVPNPAAVTQQYKDKVSDKVGLLDVHATFLFLNYQFSWGPNRHFKTYYADSADIQQYVEAVADQHDLRQYIKTSHKVLGAKWIEEKQKWDHVVCSRGITDGEVGETFVEECDVFINATGFVCDWKWPDIPNRNQFQGQMLHSAAYDTKANLVGKTVALIGNGSNGVQILPAIIDQVEKVYVYIHVPPGSLPASRRNSLGQEVQTSFLPTNRITTGPRTQVTI
ncbi:hypothetical protein LTS15_009469 [Exophiala xenobiotica]|nr:hypothetical protein LTS15_009469 [Exophiala xenobiotica]